MLFKSLAPLSAVILLVGCASTFQHVDLGNHEIAASHEESDIKQGRDKSSMPGENITHEEVTTSANSPATKTLAEKKVESTTVENTNSTKTWEISPADKTLQAALERWATAAGWQLSWGLKVDYPITTSTTIVGTFDHAIEVVVKSMATSDVPIKVLFYNGNKVVRVVAKGGE